MSRVSFLRPAQIALDALMPNDREKALSVIKELADFPLSSLHKTHSIKRLKDHYIARLGLKYRIVFRYQDREVTIVDIVNRDRLERLYGSLEVHST